jgi:hypothetical protein
MCTTCYNIKTSSVPPHSLFTCSECFSQHTLTLYSHRYHRLVFIMHTDRVLCEVATQFHTLFTDTCRPGISPGPVRADIRWGRGFPVSTAVLPHQCSILIFILTQTQSGQAYKRSHKAMLCRKSVAAAQVRTCQSERCVAYGLAALLFTVRRNTHRMIDG